MSLGNCPTNTDTILRLPEHFSSLENLNSFWKQSRNLITEYTSNLRSYSTSTLTDSYEPVLFSEAKNRETSVVQFLNKWQKMLTDLGNIYFNQKHTVYIILYSMCQGSVMCHLFLPLVSIFGLFPRFVSCHYELICVQLCVCDCVNYPVYISPVFWVWFRLVYLWLPGVSVHVSPALSCLVLPWCLH